MSNIVLSAGGKNIVLSAGGTGGHLFPAEALAEELLSRGHHVTIITDKRGNAFKTLAGRVDIHAVKAATLKAGIVSKAFAVLDMVQGIFSAYHLLKQIKPDLVVGFGGYSSFPAVFAAQLMGKRTMLHEQNAVMGKANMALSRFAKKIALSFPDTKGIRRADLEKTVVTGNPVRQPIIDLRAKPYQSVSDGGDFMVLVTGGSQAARIFADVLPAAAALLPQDLKKRLFVMHQCRADDIGRVSDGYIAAGVRADIKAFYPDIADRLAACHLFIGRSGASTVTEIAVAGRPAIFVPLTLSDGQQKLNAEFLTKARGGWIIAQNDFKPDVFAKSLAELMQQPDLLARVALAALQAGNPAGAARLADLVEKTA